MFRHSFITAHFSPIFFHSISLSEKVEVSDKHVISELVSLHSSGSIAPLTRAQQEKHLFSAKIHHKLSVTYES
jgi:hypothetical protein